MLGTYVYNGFFGLGHINKCLQLVWTATNHNCLRCQLPYQLLNVHPSFVPSSYSNYNQRTTIFHHSSKFTNISKMPCDASFKILYKSSESNLLNTLLEKIHSFCLYPNEKRNWICIKRLLPHQPFQPNEIHLQHFPFHPFLSYMYINNAID